MQSLETATATRRHIILLTDGWSTSGQYDDILARMKAAGITLSTVGAGGGANPFLEQLATQGGGRYYAAANPASIPDIFLKETQQVSGQQIIEEPFFPIKTSSSPILRGVEDAGLPRLLGYNGTTAKPAAQTVLVTARDDPLLAQWQYGLGRSVAWTSDSTGPLGQRLAGLDGLLAVLQPARGLDVPGRGDGRHRGVVRHDGRPDDAARRERRGRRLAARLLLDDGGGRRAGPRRRAQVSLVQVARASTRRRSASSSRGRTRCGSRQTTAGVDAAGPDGRAGRADRGGVPPAGANEPFLASLRSATGGSRGGPADRSVDPRPDGDLAFHRPVAAAARPGVAPVAARHRPAAGLGRAARAGRSARAGPGRSGDRGDRAAARTANRRGPVRGAGTGGVGRDAGGDASAGRGNAVGPRRWRHPSKKPSGAVSSGVRTAQLASCCTAGIRRSLPRAGSAAPVAPAQAAPSKRVPISRHWRPHPSHSDPADTMARLRDAKRRASGAG